jgi:hypothetical protein
MVLALILCPLLAIQAMTVAVCCAACWAMLIAREAYEREQEVWRKGVRAANHSFTCSIGAARSYVNGIYSSRHVPADAS